MNKMMRAIRNRLVAITLKKNRLLGRLGLLPEKSETWGTTKEILKLLTSSNISLQLHKEDGENKEDLFSLIKTLDENGIQVTLTEFDKIFSNEDIEKINEIAPKAKTDFRYVYPNFFGATNINTEMDTASYLRTLKKIRHLVKVATSNFTRKEEQIMFIADQISDYVDYDYECDETSQEKFLSISSLQGCLEGRKTVCAGFAFAFERCMTEMGIDNMIIMAYGGDKEEPSVFDNNHVWNRVRLNGEWYNVDVTWILRSNSSKIPKEDLVKKYILTSDRTFRNESHRITDHSGIPESKEDFPGISEIYDKVKNVANVLEEYDNGNTSTFLRYKDNCVHDHLEKPTELGREPRREHGDR